MRLKVNVTPVYAFLDDLTKQQMPYAVSLALTRTAQYARRQVIDEMKRAFDRPKPSTVNEERGPLYLKTASKSKYPNDYAEVRVKDAPMPKGDPAIAYLSHHIHGGARVEKRSEHLLRRAGILPPGYYMVPGDGARLDRYGNMSSGQVQQILAALGASRHADQNTRRPGSGVTDRRGKDHSRSMSKGQADYFVAHRGRSKTAHLAEGVWQRYGRNRWQVRPVLMFVRGAPRYRRRLRFNEICDQTAQFRFPRELHLALKLAIATARVKPNQLARAA